MNTSAKSREGETSCLIRLLGFRCVRRFLRKFETAASATSEVGFTTAANLEVLIESLAATRFLAVVAGVPPAWSCSRRRASCLYSFARRTR